MSDSMLDDTGYMALVVLWGECIREGRHERAPFPAWDECWDLLNQWERRIKRDTPCDVVSTGWAFRLLARRGKLGENLLARVRRAATIRGRAS